MFAGTLAAALDIYSGVIAWNKGERTLATLYWTSGTINLILAYAAWLVGTVFFWPAVAIAMVMAVVLASYKETMLKNGWVDASLQIPEIQDRLKIITYHLTKN